MGSKLFFITLFFLAILLQNSTLGMQGKDHHFDELYTSIIEARKSGDKVAEFEALVRLIAPLSNDRQHKRAIEVGERALELIPYIQDSQMLKWFYNVYAIAVRECEGNFGSKKGSIALFHKGIDVKPSTHEDNFWLYSGLGVSYFFETRRRFEKQEEHQPFLDSARYYFELAKTYGKENSVYNNLKLFEARLHFFSPDSTDFLKAYQIGYEAQKDTLEMELNQHLLVLDLMYAAALRYRGQDSIIQLMRRHNDVYKRMLELDRQNIIQEYDRKYELDFKEEELGKANSAIQARNRTLLLVFAVLLMVTVMAFYFRRLLLKNKRLAQRNDLLIREQNHRVKNNLQMISSLLSLQVGKTLDEASKEALQQSQGRIQAIALLNRSLYDQEEIGDVNLKEYIQELITEVINSITNTEVKYRLDIDDIKLDLEKTTSLGLIINELIVNSVKYVKKSVTEFSISIKQQAGKFSLEYSDNGEGFDFEAYQNSKSFGKKLIELQAKQLKGKIGIDSHTGFSFGLAFT